MFAGLELGAVANSGSRSGSGAGTRGSTLPSSGEHSPGRGCSPLQIPGGPGSQRNALGSVAVRMPVEGPEGSGKTTGEGGGETLRLTLSAADSSSSGPRAGLKHPPHHWRQDILNGDKGDRSLPGKLSGGSRHGMGRDPTQVSPDLSLVVWFGRGESRGKKINPDALPPWG